MQRNVQVVMARGIQLENLAVQRMRQPCVSGCQLAASKLVNAHVTVLQVNPARTCALAVM